MKARLNIVAVSPAPTEPWRGWRGTSREQHRAEARSPPEDAGFADQRLRVLPRHALQGCAAHGETEQRLYGLDAWREAPYYTDREWAALEWVESLTQITQGHVPDDLYERARQQFSERELVDFR